jgi:hypothetical protein
MNGGKKMDYTTILCIGVGILLGIAAEMTLGIGTKVIGGRQ